MPKGKRGKSKKRSTGGKKRKSGGGKSARGGGKGGQALAWIRTKAKQIRNSGESWSSAISRASKMYRNK
jgi:hypothetical protein